MSFALPWGFDRALGYPIPLSPYGTGGTGIVGTPAPNSAVLVSGSTGAIYLEEMPDSPTIERGEQATAQHKFRCDPNTALSLISAIGMGLIVQDSGGNVWRVLTASIQSQGAYTALTTVSESVSFDTPPDDFQVNTCDMGIDIIKHPRYFPNLYPSNAELGTETGIIKETIIRAIQTYRDSPFFPTTSALAGLLNGMVQENVVGLTKANQFAYLVPNPSYDSSLPTVADIGSDGSPTPQPANTVHLVHFYPSTLGSSGSIDLAIAAAMEIITKLWRLEDSPYVPGIEIKWSQYYFLPPVLNLGSFIQDPTFIIPNYFLQPDRPIGELPPRGGISYPVAGSNNIFQYNYLYNPQDYSSTGNTGGSTNISWLRKADEIEYQRTWFKITYTWVGSVIGYFDPQIYSGGNRPSSVGDYVIFS